MKLVTINVDEEVYRRFQEHAARNDVSAAQLIRLAMDAFDREQLSSTGSIFDGEPWRVGKVLKEYRGGDDLLDEMLG